MWAGLIAPIVSAISIILLTGLTLLTGDWVARVSWVRVNVGAGIIFLPSSMFSDNLNIDLPKERNSPAFSSPPLF